MINQTKTNKINIWNALALHLHSICIKFAYAKHSLMFNVYSFNINFKCLKDNER